MLSMLHAACLKLLVFFNTHFKTERILNICIFSQLCIWDCLPVAIWHHVTGHCIWDCLPVAIWHHVTGHCIWDCLPVAIWRHVTGHCIWDCLPVAMWHHVTGHCMWDCLPVATWRHVTGHCVTDVLRQFNGLQSSADDCTMTQRNISEERNFLCICMQRANCRVQQITACPIDWGNFYCYSAVTVKDHDNKWLINTTSALDCVRYVSYEWHILSPTLHLCENVREIRHR